MQHEVERRTYGVDMKAVEVRAEGDDKPKTKKIEGYAAVYSSPSEDMGFREIIMPGAFDRAIREGHDVRCLLNHDTNIVLGRTKSGTLRLSVDDRGLKIENDMPDTQAGRDTLTLIERGDIDQMSFAFRTIADNWRTEDGNQIRELLDVELLDVSPVAYPAYAATVVSARALAEVAKRTAPPEPVVAAVEPDQEPGPATVPNDLNALRLGEMLK
jgi:HK97 family phage prohead protease